MYETEAADVIVRFALQGATEVLRFTFHDGLPSAFFLAKKIIDTGTAIKYGGIPKEIATDPNGMVTITIPDDRYKEFKSEAKKYHLKSFRVHDKDSEFSDICVGAMDVGTVNRIVEKLGIIPARAGDIEVELLNNSKLADNKKADFKTMSEKYAEKAETIDEALNRNTDRTSFDLSQYIIADRTKPDCYITVDPTIDVFRGDEYTKHYFNVFNEGKAVGEFNDGRFKGRDIGYWSGLKQRMLKEANMKDGDLIYFKNSEAHSAYVDLYKNQTPEDTPKSIEIDISEKDINDIPDLAAKLDEIMKNASVYEPEEKNTQKKTTNSFTADSERRIEAQQERAYENGREPGTAKTDNMMFYVESLTKLEKQIRDINNSSGNSDKGKLESLNSEYERIQTAYKEAIAEKEKEIVARMLSGDVLATYAEGGIKDYAEKWKAHNKQNVSEAASILTVESVVQSEAMREARR